MILRNINLTIDPTVFPTEMCNTEWVSKISSLLKRFSRGRQFCRAEGNHFRNAANALVRTPANGWYEGFAIVLVSVQLAGIQAPKKGWKKNMKVFLLLEEEVTFFTLLDVHEFPVDPRHGCLIRSQLASCHSCGPCPRCRRTCHFSRWILFPCHVRPPRLGKSVLAVPCRNSLRKSRDASKSRP